MPVWPIRHLLVVQIWRWRFSSRSLGPMLPLEVWMADGVAVVVEAFQRCCGLLPYSMP